LNRSLCGKFESHFVTAAYLFVDLERGIVRYAGAGHPPMVFAHTGNCERVEANGLILGITEDAEYPFLEKPFGIGDRCVIYTDGVVEANNPTGEEFGAERFAEFWRRHAGVSADLAIEEFLSELGRWTGRGKSGWEDDITLVVVERDK
jgi:serine phosphatase RsbU (regulator of sigma subunit)